MSPLCNQFALKALTFNFIHVLNLSDTENQKANKTL